MRGLRHSPGKRILLTPNRDYEKPAVYDQSGLRIRAEGPGFHRFVVRRILLQSPAAASGIESGDIIESVDNHSAEELTLTELRRMLCRPNGRYTISIKRENSDRRVTLQLRPLL